MQWRSPWNRLSRLLFGDRRTTVVGGGSYQFAQNLNRTSASASSQERSEDYESIDRELLEINRFRESRLNQQQLLLTGEFVTNFPTLR